jgi:hypothetical protein
LRWKRLGRGGDIFGLTGEEPRLTPVTLDLIDQLGPEEVARRLGLGELPEDGAWAPASPRVALSRLTQAAA